MNSEKKTKNIKRFAEKITNFFRRITRTTESQEAQKKVVPKRREEPQEPGQMTIEKSKFTSWQRAEPEYRPMMQELPGGYNEDKIALQVRDPWWIHSYWELTQQTKDKLRYSLSSQYDQANWALRVYDVSFIIFNGNNAHSYFDILINPAANNWYINVSSGRSFCVDLGLKLNDGSFIMVLHSNTVTTPLDGPSWIMDEEWLIPDDLFSKLYGLSFGAGSSPRKGIKEIMKQRFISSPGLASMASPVKIKQLEKQFWLTVNTELIVYGATEPDAKVTVQDRQIKLNKDGTFSLRFALPDGKQVIPVRAESKDGIDVRLITPVVTKESK